jgi:hypothetical protein
MKKILMLLMFGMFLISLTSALDCPTYEYGQEIQITAVCDNCSYVNLTQVTYPNGTFALYGPHSMTKNITTYNYTFDDTHTTGTYRYVTCGNLNGVTSCEDTTDRCFEITYSGEKLSSSQSIIYILLFAVLLFLFIANIFAINKLPSTNATDEEGNIMKISMLKYLRSALWFIEWMFLIAIVYISSNVAYGLINDDMFSNILLVMFRVMMGMTPIIVIVWFFWIFVKIVQDKEAKNLFSRIKMGELQ